MTDVFEYSNHFSFVSISFVPFRCLLIFQTFKDEKLYRVSQKEGTKLRESVPYVELYRYNPKHLYPKLNGYRDNCQRKVLTSCISAYCTSSAVAH